MNLIFALLCSMIVRADIDPLSGTRTSLVTTQKTLAAPFLPNLNSTRAQLGAQVSYLNAKLAGTSAEGTKYSGDFAGASGGFSYSPPLQHGIGYYGGAVVNQMSGQPKIEGGSATTLDFKTTGLVASLGANARVIGRDDDPSIVSVFASASILYFKSVLTIGAQTFTSSPLIPGATVGAQWRLKLGKFLFNPYGLAFQSMNDACTSVETQGTVEFANHCPGNPRAVALKPSFTAYGLVFGYGKFAFNVYAKLMNDRVLKDISVQNYALSYTF